MTSHAHEIAARLVAARQKGAALKAFPGAIPEALAEAYVIQDAAIGMWGDEVAGWKIGLIAPHLRERLGAERVVGPIFSRAVSAANGAPGVAFPVFRDGFAAVEAEIVFRIGRDAPAEKLDWTIDEAAGLVGAALVGIETAGSPLAIINDLGPTVVASDFGNNAGVIVGAEIDDWRRRLPDLEARTLIDGEQVGEGRPMSLPGGPVEGLRFLAEHLARRGRPLRAGQLVSSGAITGVHDILQGQACEIVFPKCGSIRARAVPF